MNITLEDLNKPADEALLHGKDETEQAQAKGVDATDEKAEADGENEASVVAEQSKDDKASDNTADQVDEDKTGGNDKNGTVPYARFAEKVAEANRLAEELARLKALEAQLTAQRNEETAAAEAGGGEGNVDFDAKLAELAQKEQDALFDGDNEAARQINIERAKLIQAESLRILREEQRRSQEQDISSQLFNAAINDAIAKYPQLDSTKEGHDAKAITLINKLAVANANAGMAKHEALADATREVAEMRGWTPAGQTPPAVDKRKDEALKTALNVNKSQPAMAEGVGNRAVAGVDLKALTQTEYEKLPQKEREALLM